MNKTEAVQILDIRPIFDRGESPCSLIEQTAAHITVGQTLVLLVPFEPKPLYAKLSRQGFEHRPEALPDGTWRVEFHRVSAPVSGEPLACGCSG